MDRKVALRVGSALLGVALTVPPFITATASAASSTTAVISESNSGLRKLSFKATASKISNALAGATGQIDVVVQLTGQPLALANGQDAKHVGGRFSHAEQVAFTRDV